MFILQTMQLLWRIAGFIIIDFCMVIRAQKNKILIVVPTPYQWQIAPCSASILGNNVSHLANLYIWLDDWLLADAASPRCQTK